MAIKRSEKEEIVADLTAELEGVKAVVFADYQGLTVNEIQELRSALRQEGARMKVLKLTLLKQVLQNAQLPSEVDFQVPAAIVYSQEDEVAPAKVLSKFAGKEEKVRILSGILNKNLLAAAEVKSLAKLPGRQELRGQVVSVLAGPMRGLVGVFSGTQRNLVYALQAIADKRA